MSSEEPKWACEYCTYENWSTSHKCTMCRATRPLHLIAEAVPVTSNQDIYNLQHDDSAALVPTTPSSSEIPNTKWSCHMCTYLNWIHTTRCSQCYTQKRTLSPVSAQTLHEHLQPLQISVKKEERGASCEDKNDRNNQSPAAVTSTTNSHKWRCVVCTYENWPRATKCVMCLTSRGRGESPELSGSASSRESPPLDANNRIIRPDLDPLARNNFEYEKRVRQIRRRMRDADWKWLNACLGVVEGDANPIEAYLSSGGDPTRQLTPNEVILLNRPSAFDNGHTLVHLAIRFHRDELLASLLSRIEGGGSGIKRVPSYVAAELATDIQRHITSSLRQRKGTFPCFFMTELTTFTLPADIEDLPPSIQEQLNDELLDRDAQKELEMDSSIINWSLEIVERLGSRLYALWNRTAGDCLLDSVLQATWGVFDRDNTMRRAMSSSLHESGHLFYPRWKEYEMLQARLLDFSLEESQWEEDWAGLLSLASQPGASLEQLHVFALAHILRRPIIVYGVKYVKSYKGEALGYARFEGVYLPLLWDATFCWKSPVALGYTRGHFSALVAMEPYSADPLGAGANLKDADDLQVTFLPLMANDGKLLPVHFLTQSEIGHEEALMRQWMDVGATEGGILVAQQRLHKRPLLVAQMLEEWLNHYRRIAQISSAPYLTSPPTHEVFSSDGESEDE